jgi:hypothetical protein
MAKRTTIDAMTDTPAYFETWQEIVFALHTREAEINREYGSNAVEVIEQPARTVAIRSSKSVKPVVQASISLSGDAIDMKRSSKDSEVPVDEAPEVIEIVVHNGAVRYVHDDLDSTNDPRAVADMILRPALDLLRQRSVTKSPTRKDEAS